jgi:hypothetical protein
LVNVLHLGPGLIDALVELDQSIVFTHHRNRDDDRNENEHEQDSTATKSEFLHLISFST